MGRAFVPVSWMCKKQIAVSHSSTESEVISSDAGPRMDCILAIDLWDLGIVLLHSSSIQPRAPVNLLRDKYCERHSDERTKNQSILVGQMLITSRRTQNFLGSMLGFFF